MSAYDLTAQLMKNDYFLDVNPRNLRRLINIITLTGRLLRAYHIEFNWNVLASWIYLVEQWPYRSSWIVMCYEENEKEFNDETTLQEIYEKISNQILINTDTLAGLDRNGRKFELFLENFTPPLNILTLRKFLPCTCNLDPYLIKLIKESIDDKNVENLNNKRASTALYRIDSQHEMKNDENHYATWFSKSNYSTVNTTKESLMLNEPIQIEMLRCNLNEMTVEDIIDSLSTIDGLNKTFIEIYALTLREKNIVGKVLACCDLDELKSELNMTFGDWQLFKNWTKQQRHFQVLKLNRERQQNSISSSKLLQLGKPQAQTLKNSRADTVSQKSNVPEVFSNLFSNSSNSSNNNNSNNTRTSFVDDSIDYIDGAKYSLIKKNKLKTQNSLNDVKKVEFFISKVPVVVESNQTTVSNINCLFENFKNRDDSSNEFLPDIDEDKNLKKETNGKYRFRHSSNDSDCIETNPLLNN